MTPTELEVRSREVIRAVLSGQAVEDGRVDCKAVLPDEHARAARQIAGLANAARAPEVLWLVGVDEGAQALTAVPAEDLATWWAQVQKCFRGVPPKLTDVRVATDGGIVLALLFDTSGVPYVVPVGGGSDRLEVPWRDGTRTRSATHGDLLDILVPRLGVPTFEILSAQIELSPNSGDVMWRAKIDAYLEVQSVTILPDHRTSATVTRADELVRHWGGLEFDTASVRATTRYVSSGSSSISRTMPGREPVSSAHLIHQDASQLIAEGPGRVEIVAEARRADAPEQYQYIDRLALHIGYRPVGPDVGGSLDLDLELVDWNDPDADEVRKNHKPLATWKLASSAP